MVRLRFHRTKAIFAIGVVVMSTVVVAAPAYASHEHTANTGVLNTANWQICVSGGAALQDGVAQAVAQLNPTDVNTTYVDCHAGTANVTVFTVNSTETWQGLTECLTGVVNGLCSLKSVKINTRLVSTQAQFRMNACHELGHVAGLGHRNTNASCMTQGNAPPIATTYDAHDLAAINATY